MFFTAQDLRRQEDEEDEEDGSQEKLEQAEDEEEDEEDEEDEGDEDDEDEGNEGEGHSAVLLKLVARYMPDMQAMFGARDTDVQRLRKMLGDSERGWHC